MSAVPSQLAFFLRDIGSPSGNVSFTPLKVTQAAENVIQSTQTATERFLANVPQSISSGASTQTIIDNLKESNLVNIISRNLIGLGQASIDISSALNENITIRENQRAIDVEAVKNQQIQINVLNERLSGQVSSLGESLSKITTEGFEPIKFLTDNPLVGGIGIGGLAVGGIVLLLLLK